MLWKAKKENKKKRMSVHSYEKAETKKLIIKNKIGIVVQYERALSVVMVNQETEQVCSR